MKSTCKSRYTMSWPNVDMCPNKSTTISYPLDYTWVEFDSIYYPSFGEIWNDFQTAYLNAPFPRLIVRFEDALFYLPQIIAKIPQCTGAEYKNKADGLKVLTGYSKIHGAEAKTSSLLAVLLTTVDKQRRMEGIESEQLERIRSTLDPELLKLFRYNLPEAVDTTTVAAGTSTV